MRKNGKKRKNTVQQNVDIPLTDTDKKTLAFIKSRITATNSNQLICDACRGACCCCLIPIKEPKTQ